VTHINAKHAVELRYGARNVDIHIGMAFNQEPHFLSFFFQLLSLVAARIQAICARKARFSIKGLYFLDAKWTGCSKTI